MNGTRRASCLIYILAAVLLVGSFACHAAEETVRQPKGGWLVAVFPLEDLSASEETRGLGEKIAAALTDGFARSGKVRVVERSRLHEILKGMNPGVSGVPDERYAVRAGLLLGANAVVLGSFHKYRDSVRISVRVVKTETAEILSTGKGTGKFTRLRELEEKLTADVLLQLSSQIP
ncbi:MAG TPA: CsgG/HfaB family protein [Syntrophales bacterium]|nr:CsgG/HfaB family protein [Syntrophales bacterium]